MTPQPYLGFPKMQLLSFMVVVQLTYAQTWHGPRLAGSCAPKLLPLPAITNTHRQWLRIIRDFYSQKAYLHMTRDLGPMLHFT